MIKKLGRVIRRLSTRLAFAVLVCAFVVIVLWKHIIITVPAGYSGIVWWRFFGGTDTVSEPLQEGLRAIFPWDKVFLYETRLQEHSTRYDVVSNDGLHLKIDVSIRWRALPRNLGLLHKSVGSEYREKLLIPEIGSFARQTISLYDAEDFYAKKRAEVQQKIYNSVVDRHVTNGIGARSDDGSPDHLILLVDILVTGVTLPLSLQQAILRKLEEAERVEQHKYRVQLEELESQRKAIEADGIRRFQEIVTPTISDAYLRWSGIQATLQMAQSPNSKVVIVGNGPGGLPVILNGFEGEKKDPAMPATGQLIDLSPRPANPFASVPTQSGASTTQSSTGTAP